MYDIIDKKGKIYLSTPEAFTIRYKDNVTGEAKDVVLARKETYPNPNSRMPEVRIGTLFDDLQRRDFCCNAIAEDEDGNLIDPFNGIQDIRDKILRCPIDARTSFNDDPLRMLRALRFSITKDFGLHSDINKVITEDTRMWSKFSEVVSQERIREEVYKMMKHDTVRTMNLLVGFDDVSHTNILEKIFAEGMWLKPTTEKK